MTKPNAAVQSALISRDIINEVNQAICTHPDSIYDNYANICTSCGKNLNMIKYESEYRRAFYAKFPALAYYSNLPKPEVRQALDRTPVSTNLNDRRQQDRNAWEDKWGRE